MDARFRLKPRVERVFCTTLRTKSALEESKHFFRARGWGHKAKKIWIWYAFFQLSQISMTFNNWIREFYQFVINPFFSTPRKLFDHSYSVFSCLSCLSNVKSLIEWKRLKFFFWKTSDRQNCTFHPSLIANALFFYKKGAHFLCLRINLSKPKQGERAINKSQP